MMLSNVCLTSICLTSVCLSVAYTSGLSREQGGLGRPKLAQRWPPSHVTRTPLSRSKGQRSRSPGRFAHRHFGAPGGYSCGRGNVLAVGKCWYVAVYSASQGASAATGRRGAGAYRGGRPPAYSLFYTVMEIGFERSC